MVIDSSSINRLKLYIINGSISKLLLALQPLVLVLCLVCHLLMLLRPGQRQYYFEFFKPSFRFLFILCNFNNCKQRNATTYNNNNIRGQTETRKGEGKKEEEINYD